MAISFVARHFSVMLQRDAFLLLREKEINTSVHPGFAQLPLKDLDVCTSFLKNTGFLPNGLPFSVFQRTCAPRHNKHRRQWDFPVPLLHFPATLGHFLLTPSQDPDQFIIEKCPGITTYSLSAHVISRSTSN
jgi:hypothetical protein